MTKYTSNSPTTSISLPLELEHRLDDFAQQEGTSKSTLILQAIEKYLEDLEDVTDAEQSLAEFQASGEKAIPLHEVMKRHGVEY